MSNVLSDCDLLVVTLCSNSEFSQQLLSYLRDEFDFVNAHLRVMPLRVDTSSSLATIKLYSHYTWMMKLVCIELQSLIANRLKPQLKRTIRLLTDLTPCSSSGTAAAAAAAAANQRQQSFLHHTQTQAHTQFDSSAFFSTRMIKNEGDNTSSSTSRQQQQQQAASVVGGTGDGEVNSKLLTLLNAVGFAQRAVDSFSELNYFDPQLIEKVIEACTYSASSAPNDQTAQQQQQQQAALNLYDLRKIRAILASEIRESAGSVNIPKASLVDELKYIVANVNERNEFQLTYAAKRKYLDALRVLVESLVLITPCDVFALDERYAFLLALIRRFVDKVTNDDKATTTTTTTTEAASSVEAGEPLVLTAELTFPVAGLLFTLVHNLRVVIARLRRAESTSGEATVFGTPFRQRLTLNSPSLADIFAKLVDYLLNSCTKIIDICTYYRSALISRPCPTTIFFT